MTFLLPPGIKGLKSSEKTSYSEQIFCLIFPFVSWAYVLKILYRWRNSKYYIEEIQLLIDTFTEDGHERKTLGKISKSYLNKLQNRAVANKDNTEDNKKVVKLPKIPIIGSILRQAFKRKALKHFYISIKFKIVVMPKRNEVVTS